MKIAEKFLKFGAFAQRRERAFVDFAVDFNFFTANLQTKTLIPQFAEVPRTGIR